MINCQFIGNFKNSLGPQIHGALMQKIKIDSVHHPNDGPVYYRPGSPVLGYHPRVYEL